MEEAVLRSKKLADDTWVIYIGNTTAYLIAGDDCGMMIDSGDTPCALRGVLRGPLRQAGAHGGQYPRPL